MKAKDLLLWLGAELQTPAAIAEAMARMSDKAIRARMRASASTQTYVTDYQAQIAPGRGRPSPLSGFPSPDFPRSIWCRNTLPFRSKGRRP